MMAFGNIEGIAPEIEAALLAVQITSPEQLLQMGSSPAGRKELAARTGIDARQLTELLNGVDLSRVKGISEVFSNLLQEAGVGTVTELSRSVPANLRKRLEETNAGRRLGHQIPKLEEIEACVAEAKKLPKILED